MREDAAIGAIIDELHLCGFIVAHFRPAWTAKGWRTPVQADAAGYPDLTAIGVPDGPAHGRCLFIEVKVGRNKTSPEQDMWLAALSGCPGVETYLWRWPDDKAEVDRILGLRVLA